MKKEVQISVCVDTEIWRHCNTFCECLTTCRMQNFKEVTLFFRETPFLEFGPQRLRFLCDLVGELIYCR